VHSITTALQGLCRQLDDDIPATPGLRHFDVTFPLNDAFDPLAWLNAQVSYPQFYWQQRNGDEELAALGACNHFIFLPLFNQTFALNCGVGCNFAPFQGARIFYPCLHSALCVAYSLITLIAKLALRLLRKRWPQPQTG
jgi:menaquinone-specific isochorismate synthase